MEKILEVMKGLLAGEKPDEAKLAEAETKAKEVLANAAKDGLDSEVAAQKAVETDWIGWGLPKLKARMIVEQLAPKVVVTVPAVTAKPIMPGMTLLPVLPDDDQFLSMLQAGGKLKSQPTDILAAIRAFFAQRLGVFDVEDRILSIIEKRATDLGEPCPEIFYDLEGARDRKAHAAILRAMGVPGRFVTERRKKELYVRLEGIWGFLQEFQNRITEWQEGWQSRMSNPAMMMNMIAMAMNGARDGLAVSGFTDAPDTGPIMDAATGVIDRFNGIFAGPNIPVARALSADSVEYRKVFDRADLAAAVGAGSREEMLKIIGVAVSADLVRAERSVAQYVLGLVKLPEVSSPQLPMYIVALKELGATIPWASLSGTAAVPGKPTRRAGAFGEEGPQDGRPNKPY